MEKVKLQSDLKKLQSYRSSLESFKANLESKSLELNDDLDNSGKFQSNRPLVALNIYFWSELKIGSDVLYISFSLTFCSQLSRVSKT